MGLEELRGETKRFHSALQRYDDGDPRHSGELVRSMLSVSAKAFSFIHFIDRHETQWRPSRPPVPKLGIVDLSAKNIRWDALPDLHKSASLGRVLHKEQEHDRVFRFVLEAEPYDCYRFTVVARPAEGEEWGAVYAESTHPMVTLAATHYPTYDSSAPREIPVEISPSTEIPPKPDLFKRPMPD